MIALLLTWTLLGQIPVRPSEGGAVTGVVRNAEGGPAVNVRVSAVAQPSDTKQNAPGAEATMSSLAVTDDFGRFRLESVPPGRYYVAAGRVDMPTYFPGVQEIVQAKLIEVTPGETIDLLEFSMKDESIRPPAATDVVYREVPLQFRMHGQARLPIYSSQGQTLLWLTRSDNAKAGSQMTATSVRAPIPSATVPGEFRASIANLPEGYRIASIHLGATDVTSSSFKLSWAATPAPPLTVELASTPLPSSLAAGSGVQVTGNLPAGLSVFLSGKPANLFADGFFEFRNVPHGRHAIVAPDGPAGSRILGASLVVGDATVENVRLTEVLVLPFAPRAPASPAEPGVHKPGAIVPLATLRGRVLEKESRRPVASGSAILTSFTQATFRIGVDGQFEFPNLFPGNYNLQIVSSGRTTVSQRVVIGDDPVTIEVTVGTDD